MTTMKMAQQTIQENLYLHQKRKLGKRYVLTVSEYT